MVTLVNFADKTFEKQRRWNSLSAKLIGGLDRVLEYGPDDLDDSFKILNKEVLSFSKGFGNYVWKPYIINKALDTIEAGNYLFYADSGSFFIRSIQPLIKLLERSGKSVLCFKFPLIEKQWTKRDAFILMDCDLSEFTETPQIMGGFIMLKKDRTSIDFMNCFQQLSSDVRMISEQKNVMGKPDYPDFISHRHDQSILSLLAKKNKVFVMNNPTDYGQFPERILKGNDYLSDVELMKSKEKVILLLNRKEPAYKYLFKYLIRVSINFIKNA